MLARGKEAKTEIRIRAGEHLQVAVFVTAALINSALLFLVEPMVAKLILPLLGGSQAVWITSVAFFQVSLLLGYAYAHGSARMLGKRTQMVLHLCLLAVALLLLPVHIPGGWVPPVYGSPVPWLLLVLMVSVGLPFLVLSATTPILQRWFALSHHSSAHEPYFLYSASTAGSILGLLIYPFALEPILGLRVQSQLWGYGHGLVLLIAVACGGWLGASPHYVGPWETQSSRFKLRGRPLRDRSAILRHARFSVGSPSHSFRPV